MKYRLGGRRQCTEPIRQVGHASILWVSARSDSIEVTVLRLLIAIERLSFWTRVAVRA